MIAASASSNVQLMYAHYAYNETLFVLTLDRALTARAEPFPSR